MACCASNTVYNCDAKTIFQASVHVLHQEIQCAKDVYSGKIKEYGSVSELLGESNLDDFNQAVLEWFNGDNHFVPSDPDHFFERAFLQLNFTDPEILSGCGFLEQAGIKCHNAFLSDYPSELYEDRLKKSNDYLLKVLNTPTIWPNIKPCQQTSCNILKWTISNSNRAFRDQIYPIDQFYGYHSRYTILMTDLATVEDEGDVKCYISRIIEGGHKFNRIVIDMRRKVAVGAIAPRCCLEKVASTIRQTINNLQLQNNKLIKTVKHKYKAATKMLLPENFLAAINSAIKQFLLPGLTNCLNRVEECIHSSSEDVGLWRIKDGERFYKQCLKWQTTTDLCPEEIHRIGLEDTQKTLERVVEVVKLLNDNGDMTLDSSHTPGEILKELFNNPKFRFQGCQYAKGSEKCLNHCKSLLSDISKRTDYLFNKKPLTKCEIAKLPEALSNGGAAAFYQEGTMDLTRPGLFYINTVHMESHIRPLMKSLTAHEAVPGHHYQIAMMIENRDLPYFRRRYSSRYAGFVEGWGLYCEHLANEIGFYKDENGLDSYDTIGYYCFELLRSTRLVVDTGIHYFKWSREKAIQYMVDSTGMNRNRIEAEVDRYCVLPGQACSYKIGKMKILKIRAELKKRPGFDLTKFHDKLLGFGSVPLEILEHEMLNDPTL